MTEVPPFKLFRRILENLLTRTWSTLILCGLYVRSGAAHFYMQKQLLLSAHLSHRSSVRLSVHLSHGWIRQKRSKLRSQNFHHRLPGRL